MLDFFLDNILIMWVIYAILFFVMGSAIILRRNKKSELRLAGSLWLLAGYALTHGVNELIIIVIKVKDAQLSPAAMNSLQVAELGFKAVSFMFILWLGIFLISDYFQRFEPLKAVGVCLTAVWMVAAVYLLGFGVNETSRQILESLSRYMFAFPGFLLSGIGLLLQIREIEVFGIPSLVKNIKGLAVTFFAAAFFTGLIVNYPVIWPATILHRSAFHEFVGVPVIFFRSWILVFITYFVIRVVDVFEVEREYRLEEMFRNQVLAEERERIARELHDGIIQSIYGVGLKLEQAIILADKRLDEAKSQVKLGKEELNQAIHDIRDYIQELQPADFSYVSLLEGIIQLVKSFRKKSVMQVELVTDGTQAEELNVIQINNVLQALRELLTNVLKHSRATRVQVHVVFGKNEVRIRVSDNGVGFEPASIELKSGSVEHHGLKNVFFRVGMLQGTVVFHATPGKGAHFEITVPYQKIYCSGGMYIEDPKYFSPESAQQAGGGI
jgi:signal transduction histidine kinase